MPRIIAQTSKAGLAAFSAEMERGSRLLARRDPAIRMLVKEHGLPTFRPKADYFDTLVDSIISQQISGSAAESILRKFKAAMGGMFDPAAISAAPDALIRGAGVSPQKLVYLRSLAQHVERGELDLRRLPKLPDDEVTAQLTAVKGIGVWTAQMFLIFSLGRLDVLPTGDLGVKRGARNAYGLVELPTPAQLDELAERNRWAPYRSIASWYMWRAS